MILQLIGIIAIKSRESRAASIPADIVVDILIPTSVRKN